VILDLMPIFSRLIQADGWLILSGILKNQVGEVAASLSRNGLDAHETLNQEEWASIIAAKRS
jgi:ribosomal protein L11 methylase PrmA